MAKAKIQIAPRAISKICFLLYIVYANVARYSLFFLKGLSSVLLVGALLTELFSKGFKAKANRSLVAYIAFALYVLVSGILVARNYDLVVYTTRTYLESLVVFYLILSYATFDKDVTFVMYVFIAQALLAAVIVIFNGVGTTRISIAENVNVNTIGVMLAYAIGFVLFLLVREKQKPLFWVLGVICISLLFVGILLAVSKKGIFSAITMFLVWILLCYKFTFKKLKIFYKILIFVALISAVVFTYIWYTTNYSIQIEILKMRMDQLYTGDSDQDRIRLFLEGFTIFLDHPIIGVGFNNSRFYSFRLTYTHSFYSEIFACTGIIGVIIFLYGLFSPLYRIYIYSKRFHEKNSISHVKLIYIISLFLVFLMLGFVQIYFYQPTLMYVLGVLTAFVAVLPNQSVSDDYYTRR